MRQKNTGTCRCCNKTFGELIGYFVVGGDETCFMACENQGVRVVASAGRGKHQKSTADSRESITMYRTGGVMGDSGPTIFLCRGNKKRRGFTDKFLRENGAAEGSTVIMTPSAFMTTESWEEMTPHVCEGFRKLNTHTDEMREWWMLEIFDGFGAHLASLDAFKKRHEMKFFSVKEEGDTSHVNQAYDKFVAKSDKYARMQSLSMLRNAKFLNKGVVDQWGLVHAGLFAIRETNPLTWVRSFEACNLNPTTRLPFPDWCKKISDHLQAGESFLAPTESTYALLPAWWHGMTPAEKKRDSHWWKVLKVSSRLIA